MKKNINYVLNIITLIAIIIILPSFLGLVKLVVSNYLNNIIIAKDIVIMISFGLLSIIMILNLVKNLKKH